MTKEETSDFYKKVNYHVAEIIALCEAHENATYVISVNHTCSTHGDEFVLCYKGKAKPICNLLHVIQLDVITKQGESINNLES